MSATGAVLRTGTVGVSVPATSANLGPGFDCLGLALELRDELEATATPGPGLHVEVEGQGAGEVPRDERHLVVRSLRTGLEALGADPTTGLRLSCRNALPHARGLGSSSAAIVGGLALARGLVEDGEERLDDAGLVALAARIEGHPDNVAPAVLGGLVISGSGPGGEFFAAPARVDPRVSAVVLVPPDPVSTEAARGLLPAHVPHADAAANSGRAALLVAALAGDLDRLWLATEDRLHQQHRRPAMPATLELVDALRADGLPATVSGAGPTVLVLLVAGHGPAAADVLARCPRGWRGEALAVAPHGVLTTLG